MFRQKAYRALPGGGAAFAGGKFLLLFGDALDVKVGLVFENGFVQLKEADALAGFDLVTFGGGVDLGL